MLCKNVGTIDRTVRAISGIGAIMLAVTALGLSAGSLSGIIAAAVGAVLILTAAFGVCPAYIPFKLSTCKVEAAQ